MVPVGVARAATRASALLVVLLLLVSCGGGDGSNGGDGSRPTISPTRTPTATLPSAEAPSPTRTPTRTPTRAERPEPSSPTRSPDRTESPEEPAVEPSSEAPAQEAPSEEPAPTSPRAEQPPDTPPDAPVEPPAEDGGFPTWAWWLLAAVAVGSLVAVPLLVRGRRRRAWREHVVEAEGELAWFARELLPGLRQAGSREQMAGGWAVGRARVAAAEDRLTVLDSTAPDEAGHRRARSLRDAVRQARVQMERLTGPGSRDRWAVDLDAIISDIESALRPPPPSSPA